MLQAIKELGELKLEREDINPTVFESWINILAQNPNQDKNCNYVLAIVFEKIKDKFEYSEIRLENTNENKIEKYLYRFRAPQGANYAPTCKITEIEKTFKNKIKSWFNKYGKGSEYQFILKLREAFEKAKDNILKDLEEEYEKIKQKKENAIITIVIKENDEIKYLGDYDEFKKLFIDLIKEDFKEIFSEHHICSICNIKKDMVSGKAISFAFKFYTLDKPGYIAGGFDEKNAWKNAPICWHCWLEIEAGKKFLEETETLSPTMGGERYYLIPKFVLGKTRKDIIEIFFEKSCRPKETLEQSSLERISEDENEILEILGEQEDLMTLNFLFYKKDKSAFKVDLLIEEVLPSRIKKIFEIKKEVDKYKIFKKNDIKFLFDSFFKNEVLRSNEVFLKIINKTFKGETLDKNILFSWFMNSIRKLFSQESYLKSSNNGLKKLVLKSFISLLFFQKLGILCNLVIKENLNSTGGGEFMNELKEKIERFFENKAFPTGFHKAVFLEGVLTQKLLDIQSNYRGSTPFFKNLKGLKMKEQDFKALYPKIFNKLEEYGKNYYRKLESVISLYMLEKQDFSIKSDELNYYFVLGMTLADEVVNLLKEE